MNNWTKEFNLNKGKCSYVEKNKQNSKLYLIYDFQNMKDYIRVSYMWTVWKCVSSSVVPDSLWPYGLQSNRLLCPWDFPGKDTGIVCHFLLQGIFPTQGSNPGLLHCMQIIYQLSYQGKIKIDARVMYWGWCVIHSPSFSEYLLCIRRYATCWEQSSKQNKTQSLP